MPQNPPALPSLLVHQLLWIIWLCQMSLHRCVCVCMYVRVCVFWLFIGHLLCEHKDNTKHTYAYSLFPPLFVWSMQASFLPAHTHTYTHHHHQTNPCRPLSHTFTLPCGTHAHTHTNSHTHTLTLTLTHTHNKSFVVTYKGLSYSETQTLWDCLHSHTHVPLPLWCSHNRAQPPPNAPSYNTIMTSRFMLTVPRSAEASQGIAIKCVTLP